MSELTTLIELTADDTELKAVVQESVEIADSCTTLDEVEAARIRLLGKKGTVTSLFRRLGALTPEERGALGRIANLLRSHIEGMLHEKAEVLNRKLEESEFARGALDVTLPGRKTSQGHRHLVSLVSDEITSIFVNLGYEMASGPEIELDYYNFEALNTPPHHPARSLQDTLYIAREDELSENRNDQVLRTQTSPVQVREMEKRKPPLYVISPGKVFRKDEIDASHSVMFHQVEGLAVDRGISMAHLKGTLEIFVGKLFGEDRATRFRPHFFPFTEPSAEMDVSCHVCSGPGGSCPLCKGSGWLEILGCGMVDPNVFGFVDYDPEEYTGFAFGIGIERVAMLKYGINDMRVLFENDVRFLRQF